MTTRRSPSLRARFGAFWSRHRTVFWALHSLWALATGVAVIVLARERYGFLPWVCLFLVLTWVSTLFFGKTVPTGDAETEKDGATEKDRAAETGATETGATGHAGPDLSAAPAAPAAPGLRQEAAGYLLRTMYQETLFFLLPFYAYSTVVGSVNLIFPLLMAGLAILSCIDLLFDRWMRTSPLFGLVFFSAVAFAALNLLLPILTPLDPGLGTSVAAVAAVGSALPIAFKESGASRRKLPVVGLGLGLLLVPLLMPQLIPPVPLRLQESIFSSGIDRETLVPADTLPTTVTTADLEGALVVLMEVFAPANVDTGVILEWTLDGEVIRTSREIGITAHDLGFRVWDAWRPEVGAPPPGEYEVVLSAGRGRMFGRARIWITEG